MVTASICVARVNLRLPDWAPRKGARCGAPALDFGDVRIPGAPVDLPLCRVHFQQLRDSADPAALAKSWIVGS
jgi:hypothetical protein